jgi:hypothetical protein
MYSELKALKSQHALRKDSLTKRKSHGGSGGSPLEPICADYIYIECRERLRHRRTPARSGPLFEIEFSAPVKIIYANGPEADEQPAGAILITLMYIRTHRTMIILFAFRTLYSSKSFASRTASHQPTHGDALAWASRATTLLSRRRRTTRVPTLASS